MRCSSLLLATLQAVSQASPLAARGAVRRTVRRVAMRAARCAGACVTLRAVLREALRAVPRAKACAAWGAVRIERHVSNSTKNGKAAATSRRKKNAKNSSNMGCLLVLPAFQVGFQVKGCFVLFSCIIGKQEIPAVSFFGQLGFFQWRIRAARASSSNRGKRLYGRRPQSCASANPEICRGKRRR